MIIITGKMTNKAVVRIETKHSTDGTIVSFEIVLVEPLLVDGPMQNNSPRHSRKATHVGGQRSPLVLIGMLVSSQLLSPIKQQYRPATR